MERNTHSSASGAGENRLEKIAERLSQKIHYALYSMQDMIDKEEINHGDSQEEEKNSW